MTQQVSRLSETLGHDALSQGPVVVKGTRDGLIKLYNREATCTAKHSAGSVKAFKAMAASLQEQPAIDPDGTMC